MDHEEVLCGHCNADLLLNLVVFLQGEDIPPLAFQIDTAKSLIECEEFALAARLVSEFLAQSPGDPEVTELRNERIFVICTVYMKRVYPRYFQLCFLSADVVSKWTLLLSTRKGLLSSRSFGFPKSEGGS